MGLILKDKLKSKVTWRMAFLTMTNYLSSYGLFVVYQLLVDKMAF